MNQAGDYATLATIQTRMLHGNPDMNEPLVISRLRAFSARLQEAGIDLYLQPMGDEFQGEYVPAYAARLPYLTGFTGSAGLGAFWASGEGHALFTDGRYTIQAATELAGSSITPINSGELSLAQWLGQQQKSRPRIGYNPWLISRAQLQAWQVQIPAEWVALQNDPVDAIWHDQPARPSGTAEIHSLAYAGASYAEKREAILSYLAAQDADGVVLALPDGINWLLNLRGSDIPFNPLLLGYYLLKKTGEGVLYSFQQSLGEALDAYLAEQGVRIASLADLWALASGIDAQRLLIDPASAAEGWWAWASKYGVTLIAAEDPTLLPKACKNEVELNGMRAAHARDGVALSKFLCWFDFHAKGGSLPDEMTVVRVLEEMRARDVRYRGPSFATIAGAGPHGAIVHYRADDTSNRRAAKGELFLLDSGGQYDDGTTDVTRTMTIGAATSEMKEHFTRVLKGHIALASVVFPEGTTGIQLDVLARQYLWQAGLDYDHGTGHGVGAFLCVHEGPQRISKRGSLVPLQPGMILSNEPGYYAAGKYGIRIENLVAVVELGQTEYGKKRLGFETLTLAPIDTRLVDIGLLTPHERNWLNAYHGRVFKTLAPLMEGREKHWLEEATQAV